MSCAFNMFDTCSCAAVVPVAATLMALAKETSKLRAASKSATSMLNNSKASLQDIKATKEQEDAAARL